MKLHHSKLSKLRYLAHTLVIIAQAWLLPQANAGVERAIDQSATNTGAKPSPNTPSGWMTAPSFSSEEEEDIGVQYLLLDESHDWFSFLADNSFSVTDNPLTLENPSESTTLNIFTATVVFVPKSLSLAGGKLSPRIGLRWQSFMYGWFAGRNDLVAGLPVKENDFEARSPFIEVSWEKNDWFLYAGVRYNDLVQTYGGSKETFYSDYNPSIIFSRRFAIRPKTDLWLQYTGDYRISDTESGGLLPDGWNDRFTQALGFTINQFIGTQWLVQAGYTFQYVDYTESQRNRNDRLHSANLTVVYAINRSFQLRAFGNYDHRNSSEAGTSDYDKFEGGLALQYTVSF